MPFSGSQGVLALLNTDFRGQGVREFPVLKQLGLDLLRLTRDKERG